MKHPFVVGKRYRNRDGEYEVLRIDGPAMEIRYTDGRTILATVETQAIILTNMRAESTALQAPARPGQGRSRHRSAPKGIRFDGLAEGDFQRGTAGTTWRARTGLGGLLAQRLSAEVGQEFQSYAIYRRAEVHIARPECYHNTQRRGWRDCKFVFILDDDGARYGLYIEKNDGPMDETWHWPRLLAALGRDKALQDKTLAAMHRLGLAWEVYAWPKPPWTAKAVASAGGLAWQREADEVELIGWPEFVERLAQIEAWCDLCLFARLGKAEAIAAGAGVAGRAVAVYRELLPLYGAAVGGDDS